MHDLFAQVLDHRDLSKAGDLFSVKDNSIVNDLTEVLEKIEDIANSRDYLTSDNDQSVVEICITRVTSAIRETVSIEKHAAALVSLLATCLKHDLQPLSKEEDTPHAKIASDVMSCVFLNYANRAVMTLAIPVAVKFLNECSIELSRNVSSYLSLAAIDHADLLAKHIEPIIKSITNGNYGLVRVLPQIYNEDKDSVNNHIEALVNLLDKCDLAETNSLVALYTQITKYEAKLLVPHVSKLCDLLKSNVTSSSILQIFIEMATLNATSFINHISTFKEMVKTQPSNLAATAQIMGTIGRQNEPQAVVIMDYLVNQLKTADTNTQAVILREIKLITEEYQWTIERHMETLSGLSLTSSASSRAIIQHLKEMHNKKTVTIDKEPDKSSWSHTENQVTVISVGRSSPSPYPYPSASDNTAHNNGTPNRVTRPYSVVSTNSSHSERTAASLISTSTSFNSANTYPIKDTVQHFCEKHLEKIKHFVGNLSAKLPLPVKCTIEERRKDKKKYAKIHFMCSEREDQCLYNKNFFPIKTKYPKIWVHIMFLNIQAQAVCALSSQEPIVASLKDTWERLRLDGSGSFVRLVTSSFPSSKDQENLKCELSDWRYFDVFEFNAVKTSWSCFLCYHPEKASGLLQDGSPVIEGQLKEKKGKWKFFKRWKTRYFTLSGANMTYTSSNKTDSKRETLPVNKIQSVKAVKKGRRDIPKAFEIFTNDQTYVLKAKDSKNAEQWVQCLHIARARSNDTRHGQPCSGTVSSDHTPSTVNHEAPNTDNQATVNSSSNDEEVTHM